MSRFGAPLGLFVLAFGLRALPWPAVLTPERVEFVGYDAYYHMRRVLYSLANFPSSLDFDRYVAFPQGARPIWSPAFDSALAMLLWPVYRIGGVEAVERTAIWIPPLLGAATVLVLYAIAHRHFGARVALVSGLVLCVLSGHFWYSQVGFIDHHAAISLVSTLLLAAVMELLRRTGEGRSSLAVAVAAGLVAAGSLLVWPGCLLYVAVTEFGLLTCLLAHETRDEAHRFSSMLFAMHGVAFLLVLPGLPSTPWPQWGAYSSVVLSRFQPWLFGAGTLFAAGCALAWRRPGHAERRSTRQLQALGIGASVLALSLLSFPELLGAVSDAWGWLARDETFQSQVGESRPLFNVHGMFSGYIAELRLSRFVYVFPFSLVALAFQRRSHSGRSAVWMLVGWSLTLFGVTLLQRRFFDSCAVVLSLAMGWSAVCVYRVATDSGRTPIVRFGIGAAVAFAMTWLLVPSLRAWSVPIQNQSRVLQGRGLLPDPMGLTKLRILQVAEWLRENSRETTGFLDAEQVPEYGVLSDWGFGHVIQYTARRPAVTDNFGDDVGEENFALARDYFAAETETSASRILDHLNTRYVIVKPGHDPSDSFRGHLYRGDGSGLTRHRLVFETPRESHGVDPTPLKVFEHVRGARLVGRAPPRSRVRAQLRFALASGRRVLFTSEVDADATGVYALHLPHSTHGRPSEATADPAYQISAAGNTAEVVVEESAVQAGGIVHGPDLGS